MTTQEQIAKHIEKRKGEIKLLEESILASYEQRKEYISAGLRVNADELLKKIRHAERELVDMKQEIHDAKESLR